MREPVSLPLKLSLVPKYESIASNLPSMLNNQGQRLGTLVNLAA